MDPAGCSRYVDGDSSDSDGSRDKVPYPSENWDEKEPCVHLRPKDQLSTCAVVPDRAFPQFNRLPIELRWLIWEAFCPDLVARLRIFDFELIPGKYNGEGLRVGHVGEIRNGDSLRFQTQAARAVMAVHRESRCFASEVLPDTLPFCRGKFDLRFNKHRDVISIDHGHCADIYIDAPCQQIPGVTDQIYQLAFDEETFSCLEPPMTDLLGAFPNLQRTFVQLDYSCTRIDDLKWCVSNKVNHKYHEESIVVHGPGCQSRRYFWPDFTTSSGRDHAQSQIPLDTIALGNCRIDSWYEGYKDRNFLMAAREAGMDIWPMAEFTQPDGEEALKRLEDYVLTGKIDGGPYGDSDYDALNGW